MKQPLYDQRQKRAGVAIEPLTPAVDPAGVIERNLRLLAQSLGSGEMGWVVRPGENLQSALDSIPQALVSAGVTLLLTDGQFDLYSPLTVRAPSVEIVGVGMHTQLNVAKSFGASAIFDIQNIRFTLRNVLLNAGTLTVGKGWGFTGTGAQGGHRFEDVWFTRAGAAPVRCLDFPATDSCLVRNCRFTGSGWSSTEAVYLADNCARVVVTDNIASSAGISFLGADVVNGVVVDNWTPPASVTVR